MQLRKNCSKRSPTSTASPRCYNIRADGKLAGRNTTAHINIVTKEDKPGIDIYIAPGTKNESVHIPVIISQTGLKDMVYKTFTSARTAM